jgi:uncharacterized phiE125 gp8 family phage protein
LRVTASGEDSLIADWIAEACAMMQELTGRAIGEQSWRLSIGPQDARARVVLPLVPVASIDAITYFDTDDAEQTATVSDFYVFGDDYAATLYPKRDVMWPTTIDRDDAIQITFTAGAATAPRGIERAVKLLVSEFDANRSATSEKIMHNLPYAVETVVAQHRTKWIAA